MRLANLNRVRLIATGTLCALASLGLPLAAEGAPPPGVTVDPGSPSSHEYAIPLEQARTDASPGSSSPSSPGTRPPLFGSGVGHASAGTAPDSSGTPSGSSGGGSHKRSKAPDRGAANRPAADTRPGSAGVRLARLADAGAGSGSETLTVPLLGALGVLLVGALAGVALRRSRPKSAA